MDVHFLYEAHCRERGATRRGVRGRKRRPAQPERARGRAAAPRGVH